MSKQVLSEEFQRMQRLAGINEIEVNKPYGMTYEFPNGEHWGLLHTPFGDVQADYDTHEHEFYIDIDQEIASDTRLLNFLEKHSTRRLNYSLVIPQKYVRVKN